MPEVTIYTTDGESRTVRCTKEEEAFYDDLPFTSENVLRTEIR